MDINKALAVARRELDKNGLHHWSVELRNYKTTGGMTYFDTEVIGLGRDLIPLWTPKQFRQILFHEMGHALAGFEAGHNSDWLSTARSLGYTGGATHDFPVVPGRWVVFCGNCGERDRKHRPVSASGLCCSECGDPVAVFDSLEEEVARA